MSTPLQDQLKARAVSAESLIGLGIDARRVDELLLGADPTIDEVRRIASSLRIPIRSLIVESKRYQGGKLKLRENFKRGADNEKEYEVFDLLARAETLAKVLPPRSELRFAVPAGQYEKTFEKAEEFAAASRSEILKADELSPLIDLESRIVRFTSAYAVVVNQRHVEAAVVSVTDHAFIFISQRNDPRMRFTLAHEFCHYLFDIKDRESSGWFDEDVLESGGSQLDEIFANGFASALLLPPSAVGRAINAFRAQQRTKGKEISDVEIIFLARFFGVSFQVAARRLEDLKLLPRGGGQSLYENIRSKFGSPERLADRLGLPPRETYDWQEGRRVLLQEAKTSVIQGAISIGRLSEIVELPLSEATRLLAK